MKTKKSLLKIFLSIWEQRNKRSVISGADLSGLINTSFFVNCFAHVIPKKGHNRLNFTSTKQREELLVYNEQNILLVSPKEHHLIDHGTEEQRREYERKFNCSFDVFFNYKENLLEYLIHVLQNDSL